jgi:hypothetical protein
LGINTPDDGGEDLFAHFSEMDAAGFKSRFYTADNKRPMIAGWSMSAATVGPMPVAWRATTCYLARTAGQAV